MAAVLVAAMAAAGVVVQALPVVEQEGLRLLHTPLIPASLMPVGHRAETTVVVTEATLAVAAADKVGMAVRAAIPVTTLLPVVPRSFPLAVGVEEAKPERLMRAVRRVVQQLLVVDPVLVPLVWAL